MIPPYISDDVKSSGEKIIFQLFENDPDTKDWVVLHSLSLSQHVSKVSGEIDFLVLAPNVGIFVLEVKSGRVEYKDGVWCYQNRYGEKFKCMRGPFKQAEEAMFSLQNHIRNKYGPNHHLSNLLFGYGVMFPHIAYKQYSIEYDHWCVFSRENARSKDGISQFIRNLSMQTKKKLAYRNIQKNLPSPKDIEKIVNLLRGDFQCAIKPKHLIEDVEAEIIKYTEEQCRALDSLEDNPRCFFRGGAGTGKTMIAMESAKRSAIRKQKTLFLCYNWPLANKLKRDLKGIENYVTVSHFHGFLSLLSENKISKLRKKKPNEYFNSRVYLQDDLPNFALESIWYGDFRPFDKIIIDEAQDLLKENYLDVVDALLDGGLAGGKWEMYGDFNQDLYIKQNEEVMLQLLEKRSNFTRCRLLKNCRNTKNICIQTSLLTRLELPEVLVRTNEMVDYYFYQNQEEHIQKVENVLYSLKEDEIPLHHITILSPRSWENSIVSKISQQRLPIVQLEKVDMNNLMNKLTFSTIHRFKGLENFYILICDIEQLTADYIRPILYVGMTRAKLKLDLFLNKNLEEERNKLLLDSLKGD
ncbi:nuclease-related domain-containing DEAD/DEAH box helicase [Thermoflavimicrobium daqui]|nr:NERD domain-containing protein [Thermoflavimicrobium daqui]